MFSNLLDASAWFTLRPAEVGGLSGTIIFGTFICLFVLGIIARIVSAHKTSDRYLRDLGQKVATLLVTMGFFGLVLYFFSFERIRLFGARFWYVLWLIGLLAWIFVLVRFAIKTLPKLRERDLMREALRKYFPPRRKK